MYIVVDSQARAIVQQMCDLALKSGGLQNMQPVLAILNSMLDYVVDPGGEPGEKSTEKLMEKTVEVESKKGPVK